MNFKKNIVITAPLSFTPLKKKNLSIWFTWEIVVAKNNWLSLSDAGESDHDDIEMQRS